MKLGNWKIGTRMLAGFGAVLALLVAVAALGIGSMGGLQSRLREITGVNNAEIREASTMRTMVDDRMIALRNVAC
ncbi:methyl-accepting chemotaxis protein [Pseudoduganella flava]|uniref:Methyl-accepting chemotaxis protein n=1 Tax=Pseudoduganella flava TaxID=871742 RepID=A0A562Q4D3_9BURK|nr:MCP four helix bundle domain-containing protein [Pseudoduganella flava]QGZ41615.1 hypothetical protein GO485_22885 [Pseudoduganella flava]TWI51605.1 methyl-accepting chemotaxis protein [Pseudoduganella flava]